MFAPSINKPRQNIERKCSCSAQEAVRFFRASPFSFSSSSTSTLKPVHVLSLASSSCLSSFSTCQLYCPPLRKSEPMQPCSCDLFNGPLSTGRVPLFLVPFLPGFGAISKGASVFPLREAWCSLLSGCDNGPHMVVLQRLTETCAHAPRPRLCLVSLQTAHKAFSSSAFCLGPFTQPELCRALCHPVWGPGASASTPSALFNPLTICHQQVFQKCNECGSLCRCECA